MSPTEFHLGFKWDSCCSIFSFLCSFCRPPLFIILSPFVWPLHCLPFFDIWFPITLLASTNFSYLLTYTRTTILSQSSNLFHCNMYVKIYWRLQLFGIINFNVTGKLYHIMLYRLGEIRTRNVSVDMYWLHRQLKI